MKKIFPANLGSHLSKYENEAIQLYTKFNYFNNKLKVRKSRKRASLINAMKSTKIMSMVYVPGYTHWKEIKKICLVPVLCCHLQGLFLNHKGSCHSSK